MSKTLTILSLMVIATMAYVSNASAYTPFAKKCIWAPNDPSVCAARAYCTPNPANSRCAKYCHVNPRDVVCGEVYQPTLPRVYPGYGSPYPWARDGGGFCYENPYNIACQQNWPYGGY